MKEMQLFEVGFKNEFASVGYWEKFYVAAKDDLDARSMARRWVEKIHGNMDDTDLDEDEQAEYLNEIASLKIARIHHIGPVVT